MYKSFRVMYIIHSCTEKNSQANAESLSCKSSHTQLTVNVVPERGITKNALHHLLFYKPTSSGRPNKTVTF
jgi:hypothetical protein